MKKIVLIVGALSIIVFIAYAQSKAPRGSYLGLMSNGGTIIFLGGYKDRDPSDIADITISFFNDAEEPEGDPEESSSSGEGVTSWSLAVNGPKYQLKEGDLFWAQIGVKFKSGPWPRSVTMGKQFDY